MAESDRNVAARPRRQAGKPEEYLPPDLIRYGQIYLPSAFVRDDGSPAFTLPIPVGYWADDGIRFLIGHEYLFGGYEYPSRLFFVEHMSGEDLFLDIGAHWGIFSLTVSSMVGGGVQVLALEPVPDNVRHFAVAASQNRLTDGVELIQAAAGSRSSLALLGFNTTMGSRLSEIGIAPLRPNQPHLHMPTVSIADIVDSRPDLDDRRIFIKIDVEGAEPDVLLAAGSLLASGRVAAVMWEYGDTLVADRSACEALCDLFRAHDFGLFHFPVGERGGALVPFLPDGRPTNVFCLPERFPRRRSYVKPAGRKASFPVIEARAGAGDVDQAAALTERRLAAGAPLGIFETLADKTGSAARAAAAARHVEGPCRILDLGAGEMEIAHRLAPGTAYFPVDVVAWVPDTIIVDLNIGSVPDGEYDAVLALSLLPFLHDVPRILREARAVAPVLICTYPLRRGEPRKVRRARGWANDYRDDELGVLLAETGWRERARENLGEETLLVCDLSEQPA